MKPLPLSVILSQALMAAIHGPTLVNGARRKRGRGSRHPPDRWRQWKKASADYAAFVDARARRGSVVRY